MVKAETGRRLGVIQVIRRGSCALDTDNRLSKLHLLISACRMVYTDIVAQKSEYTQSIPVLYTLYPLSKEHQHILK